MKNIRSFIIGFLCAAVIFSLSAVAFAAVKGTVKTSGPSVKVDGEYLVFGPGTFKLSNGCDAPSSLMYIDETGGGTTYVPLRSIFEELGISVSWDAEDYTVVLETDKYGKNQTSAGTGNAEQPYTEGKASISSTGDLENYINKALGTISTPFGDYNAKVTITENTRSYFPQDYEVRTECYFPWYDLKYSIKYTDEQKAEAISILREYQEKVYDIASEYLPGKKISGGYYLGYYNYPNLKVDYESERVFSWQNFTDGIALNYDEAAITYFHWYNVYDDYVFD